jgi:16S rRNA (uracil1498-N3)-methyltransferase
MRRFFVDQGAVSGDRIVISDTADIHHMLDVLRMKEGARLWISDRTDTEYEAVIAAAGPREVVLDVLSSRPFRAEPRIDVTLYQGIPKGQKMDLVVQKSVELGVNRIVPLITERVVPDAPEKKLSRWRRIAAETVKQCQRGVVPEVAGPMTLARAAEQVAAGAYGRTVVLYELEEGVTLKEAVKPGNDIPESFAVFVGPEGGFARSEVDALVAAGATAVTLGPTILRTETAGPAALAMLLYEYSL